MMEEDNIVEIKEEYHSDEEKKEGKINKKNYIIYIFISKNQTT